GPPEEIMSEEERGAGIGNFTWLADGHGIITSRGPNGPGSLRLVDLRQRTVRAITGGLTRDRYPALSPDGRALAYTAADAAFDILEVPLDSSAPRTVLASTRMNVAPSWAPDGTHFAYVTDRGGASEIWLHNRQDGSERLIVGPKDLPGGAAALIDT